MTSQLSDFPVKEYLKPNNPLKKKFTLFSLFSSYFPSLRSLLYSCLLFGEESWHSNYYSSMKINFPISPFFTYLFRVWSEVFFPPTFLFIFLYICSSLKGINEQQTTGMFVCLVNNTN